MPLNILKMISFKRESFRSWVAERPSTFSMVLAGFKKRKNLKHCLCLSIEWNEYEIPTLVHIYVFSYWFIMSTSSNGRKLALNTFYVLL